MSGVIGTYKPGVPHREEICWKHGLTTHGGYVNGHAVLEFQCLACGRERSRRYQRTPRTIAKLTHPSNGASFCPTHFLQLLGGLCMLCEE